MPMLSEEEVKEIARAFVSNKEDVLDRVEFVLWIGFLGPRTSYRELRLYEIEPEFSAFAFHAFKLKIRGSTLRRHITAFETETGEFIEVDHLNEEMWVNFITDVKRKTRPRVILDDSFRKRFGLPSILSELEIFVLDINYQK